MKADFLSGLKERMAASFWAGCDRFILIVVATSPIWLFFVFFGTVFGQIDADWLSSLSGSLILLGITWFLIAVTIIGAFCVIGFISFLISHVVGN